MIEVNVVVSVDSSQSDLYTFGCQLIPHSHLEFSQQISGLWLLFIILRYYQLLTIGYLPDSVLC